MFRKSKLLNCCIAFNGKVGYQKRTSTLWAKINNVSASELTKTPPAVLLSVDVEQSDSVTLVHEMHWFTNGSVSNTLDQAVINARQSFLVKANLQSQWLITSHTRQLFCLISGQFKKFLKSKRFKTFLMHFLVKESLDCVI